MSARRRPTKRPPGKSKKPPRAAKLAKKRPAAPRAKKRRASPRTKRPTAAPPGDATIEFSTEATQQVPVAEVLGDIEEAMALDRLSEHEPSRRGG